MSSWWQFSKFYIICYFVDWQHRALLRTDKEFSLSIPSSIRNGLSLRAIWHHGRQRLHWERKCTLDDEPSLFEKFRFVNLNFSISSYALTEADRQTECLLTGEAMGTSKKLRGVMLCVPDRVICKNRGDRLTKNTNQKIKISIVQEWVPNGLG